MGHQTLQLFMRLYSYVVARDYGFAPNPFYGYCTLATCKPKIRARAAVGDWVVGTGAKTKYNLVGHLIYAMKVEEILDFDLYWRDPRFLCKRPVANGSLKQVYGDNIYHRDGRRWIQADSHHSLKNGRPNSKNVSRDTSADRVLVARKFVYFGSAAPPVPKRFRAYARTGEDICTPGQGHRVISQELAKAFEHWLERTGKWGLRGMPLEFDTHERVALMPSRDTRATPLERAKASGRT